MRCLSIDYRLAPENTFPAAINDTYTSYKWLLEQGVTPADIVVGGISAGGGLTLALLLKLKETGESQPAGAVPMSAWTDLTQSGDTMHTNAESDPVICKAYLDRMAGLYLGPTQRRRLSHRPAPAANSDRHGGEHARWRDRARCEDAARFTISFGDLTGLPPLLIQIGTAESMLDDSRYKTRFAAGSARAMQAGKR